MQDVKKRQKLLVLSKDYAVKALAGLDEIISMADEVDKMEDPELIKSYLENMDKLEAEIDKNYKTACHIRDSAK